jgi:hypothetical protein
MMDAKKIPRLYPIRRWIHGTRRDVIFLLNEEKMTLIGQ